MKIKEAEKLIQTFQEEVPVDIYGLAKALGIKVLKTDEFSAGVSGSIHKEDSGSYVIFTNSRDHIHRRRFTVAHEIAHYVLHKELIKDGIVDDGLYRSRLGGPLERQANAYAAQILMPTDQILKAINDGAKTTRELAEKFRVSAAAMSIRIGIP